MTKSGSTSIQHFLFHQLADPRFHFAHFGKMNGSLGLTLVFVSPTLKLVRNVLAMQGIPLEALPSVRESYLRQLEDHCRRAKEKGAALVLSGESLWNFDRSALLWLRDFLAGHSFEVEVIGYVRPRKARMECVFYQRLKARGGSDLNSYIHQDGPLRYRERLEALDAVFGKGQVGIRLFHRDSLEQGCVVKDFCTQTGIEVSDSRFVRYNESLRLPAVRLLYALRRFGGVPPLREGMVQRRYYGVAQKLSCLAGPPVRFHSELVAPFLALYEAEHPWLEERLGFSLREDIHRDDDGPCIRSEADLFDFDPESLEWLAEQTGGKPVRPTRDEAAARAVAAQVRLLDKRWSSQHAPPRSQFPENVRRWFRTLFRAGVRPDADNHRREAKQPDA
jgi:hypothetical protein